ncbi:MAG: hypothetical protein RR280_05740 [Bacteroidaceae bacterium]
MKQMKLMMMAALCALTFTACDDDENDYTWTPQPTDTEYYILNQGNYSSGIDGTLSSMSYNGTYTDGIFKTANEGMSLGNTPQNAVAYGSHLYFAVSGDQTGGYALFVADRTTRKVQKKITMFMPRDLVAYEGKVYVSGFGETAGNGTVARIDTTTFETVKTPVGSYPEELVAANGYLYVTNSGYMKGETVSKVNLKTFKEEKQIKVGLNPTRIAADAMGNVFVVTTGNYATIPAAIQKIAIKDDAVTPVAEATQIAVHGTTLYALNSITNWTLGTTVNTYFTVNTVTGSIQKETLKTTQEDQMPKYPTNIFVSPWNGHIFVPADNDESGYANWSGKGYLYEYDAKGMFVKKTNVGVHPVRVVFNMK